MNSIQYGPNYPICPNRDAKQTHIDEKRELRDRYIRNLDRRICFSWLLKL